MFLFTTAPVHTLTLYALLDGWTVFLLLTAALLALGLPQRLCALADGRISAPAREGIQAVFYAALFFLSVLALASAAFNPFIYFQF